MSDDPLTNGAVEWLRRAHALVNRLDSPPSHNKPAGFTMEDLRTRSGGTNLGRLDGEQFEVAYNASWEFGNQRPQSSIAGVHAIGGENMAVVTERVDFGNDMPVEAVVPIEVDPELHIHRRSIMFDLDDVDAAIEELHRLGSEGNSSEDHPPTTR